MRRTTALLTVSASAVACVLLAGCQSSSSPAPSGSPSAASTAAAGTAAASVAAASTAASAAASPGGSSAAPAASGSDVATSLDPCQLVTSAEASALAGTTFGPGKEEPSGDGKGKLCVYGAQTTNVFMVLAGQDASPAAAQADWSNEEAQVKTALTKQVPSGVKLTEQTQDVSGLGDRAATVSGSASLSGQTIGESAIYLLKGATFVSFSDLVLGHPAPTASALEGQARTTLGRVP